MVSLVELDELEGGTGTVALLLRELVPFVEAAFAVLGESAVGQEGRGGGLPSSEYPWRWKSAVRREVGVRCRRKLCGHGVSASSALR